MTNRPALATAAALEQSARTLVVSGASSGIGRAITERLLDDGHSVIGVGRNCALLEPYHNNFYPFEIDLAQLKTVPEALKRLCRQFPQIDGAVFSAGRGDFGALEQFSYDQIAALIDLNFTSVAMMARALTPMLKKRRAGDLIFIGSEAALQGKRNGAIYCATKFALRGLSQALREECSGRGVRVTLINPGMVKTGFFDQLDFEPGEDEQNFIAPEEVADLVLFTLKQRGGGCLDEINLTPLQPQIRFKR